MSNLKTDEDDDFITSASPETEPDEADFAFDVKEKKKKRSSIISRIILIISAYLPLPSNFAALERMALPFSRFALSCLRAISSSSSAPIFLRTWFSCSRCFFLLAASSISCFCLAMMKSVRSRCSLPVSCFRVPRSISRHSATMSCIRLMSTLPSLQDLPVS